MVGGGEVVQAIVTTAFPILRLDTVPLVALAVAGCCLLLLWVILRWRQEPHMPELRETCSVLRAAYCPCLHQSPPPTPNLTRQASLRETLPGCFCNCSAQENNVP